jgi:hypothetical protein
MRMSELLQFDQTEWFASLTALLVLLLFWLWYRKRRARKRSVDGVLKEIGYDRINDLVIPNGDEGEILIDHLILTSQGLLIVDAKDVQGIVFGSDKMQDWTVISSDRRYTFSNPQPALYDRIAAVRHIVRQVPVAGRIVFIDGAEFTKGVPGLVCDLDELLEQFGEKNKSAAKVKVEAFRPHWDLIRKEALNVQVDDVVKRRRS